MLGLKQDVNSDYMFDFFLNIDFKLSPFFFCSEKKKSYLKLVLMLVLHCKYI